MAPPASTPPPADEPDLDALLASLNEPEPEAADEPDLDALLASLNEPEAEAADEPDLDALLASLNEPEPEAADEPDLDALLASLNEPEAEEETEEEAPEPAPVVAAVPPPRARAAPAPVAPAPAAPAPAPVAPAPVAAAPLPPPPRPTRTVRTPPTPIPPPEDLDAEESTRWAALDGLIHTSWQAADSDEGSFWFTLVGRQGPPVILIGASDTEPNRAIARPDGDAARRALAAAGGGKFYRFTERGIVKLMLTSGLGSPEARTKVTQELERLAYFPGLAVKF